MLVGINMVQTHADRVLLGGKGRRGLSTMVLTDKDQSSPFQILLCPASMVFLSQKEDHVTPLLSTHPGFSGSCSVSLGQCRGLRGTQPFVSFPSPSRLWLLILGFPCQSAQLISSPRQLARSHPQQEISYPGRGGL